MYFWNFGLRKMLLDICLKSPVSEDPWRNNKVNGPNQCWNLNDGNFTIFIDHCEENRVRKILFSDRQHLKTAYYHIHCLWKVFSSTHRQFNATNSYDIISVTKKCFWKFFGIFKIYLKFGTFCKKWWSS